MLIANKPVSSHLGAQGQPLSILQALQSQRASMLCDMPGVRLQLLRNLILER